MCVNYKLCVKLHKGPFAFDMEKFLSLENFYTHAVTGVTDNYQVCISDYQPSHQNSWLQQCTVVFHFVDLYTIGSTNLYRSKFTIQPPHFPNLSLPASLVSGVLTVASL